MHKALSLHHPAHMHVVFDATSALRHRDAFAAGVQSPHVAGCRARQGAAHAHESAAATWKGATCNFLLDQDPSRLSASAWLTTPACAQTNCCRHVLLACAHHPRRTGWCQCHTHSNTGRDKHSKAGLHCIERHWKPVTAPSGPSWQPWYSMHATGQDLASMHACAACRHGRAPVSSGA